MIDRDYWINHKPLSGFFTTDNEIIHIKSRDMAHVYTLGPSIPEKQALWCGESVEDKPFKSDCIDVTSNNISDMKMCPKCAAAIVRYNINSNPYFVEAAIAQIIEFMGLDG